MGGHKADWASGLASAHISAPTRQSLTQPCIMCRGKQVRQLTVPPGSFHYKHGRVFANGTKGDLQISQRRDSRRVHTPYIYIYIYILIASAKIHVLLLHIHMTYVQSLSSQYALNMISGHVACDCMIGKRAKALGTKGGANKSQRSEHQSESSTYFKQFLELAIKWGIPFCFGLRSKTISVQVYFHLVAS